MPTQLDIRQSVYRSALNMAGTGANATVDGIIAAYDPEIGKLFEDRNVLLTDGGTITFTGTQLQFTENVNITLNQKISGAVPQVISLGSGNQNFTSSGDMWVAVVNRTAGTATTSIITAGSPLPAVSNANQEVFLIAKRVDAGDGTQRIYWRNGFAMNAGQTLRLGQGGGTGSGVGGGSDLNSLQFRAQFIESFTESTTSAVTAVNGSAGFTNATYNAAKQMYVINYDASKTINTTGLAATLSGTPSFTVAAGDVVVNLATLEVRKITAISTQTSYTLEAAFSSNLVAQAVCVSQAVHTKDIYNYNANSTAASLAAAFPGSTFSEIMVDYEDNATSGSNLWTPDTAPFVAYVGSTDNTNWMTAQTRATNETDTMQSDICPTAGSSLYLRFFSDKSSGTGFVNLLNYEAFMQKSLANTQGGIVWSSYGMTNNSTTAVNCTISVVGGKTTVTFTNGNQYAVGANPGQTFGILDVYVNGQMFPRFVSGTVPTTDGYYTEVSPTVIQLDKDYSSQALEVQVVLRTQIVDASTTNTTAISQLQEIVNDGFQDFVNVNENLMTATSNAGSPVAGTFYSSISGRAPIMDLTQDLKARHGIERIMIQSVSLLQGEFGPNGENVYSVLNDTLGKARFVGTWSNTIDASGARPASSGTANADFLEITFYGTGLNLLCLVDNNARTFTAGVDGGAQGSNLYPASGASAMGGRGYSDISIVNLTTGLSLGVHTVKVVFTGSVNQTIYGYEVINQNATASNVKVNPGVSYVNGKKLVNTAGSLFAYNAIATGSRGGRVVVYQASDGSIGSAWQAAGSQLNYPSADHTNEDVARVYWPREFGAGRADDYSRMVDSSLTAAFTLEDGYTTLRGSNNRINTSGFGGVEGLFQNGTGDFTEITFIGTGLDVVNAGNSVGTVNFVYSINVDGTTIVSGLTGATLTTPTTLKIVSGLAYGVHTVRITTTTGSTTSLHISRFIVYQPKKPAIPSGAIELADYNVMANYDSSGVTGTTTADWQQVPVGTMPKAPAREYTYISTAWSFGAVATTTPFGFASTTGANNSDPVQYTWWGTGAMIALGGSTGGTYNFTVTIDGSLNASGVAKTNASNLGGGSYQSTSSTGDAPCRIEFTGLALGLHTISIQRTAGTGNFNFEAIYFIVPIHSHRNNLYADLQNALPVGSNSVSDNRVFNPTANTSDVKAWAQAVGVTSGPSTSSTTPVPVPDLSLTVKTSGGSLDISWGAEVSNATTGNGAGFTIYVDGLAMSPARFCTEPVGTDTVPMSQRLIIPVNAGLHKIDLFWQSPAGTAITATGTRRELLVKEM